MVGWKLFYVFFVCVLPWVELRGAIPLGATYGYDVSLLFIGCVIVNILLIPFIFLFLDLAVPIVTRIEIVERLYQYATKRARRSYKKYEKYELIGLALFVGVPLPGSGVYSGTLIAYIFGFRRKKAFLSIATGAVIAGIIVTLVTQGAISIF
ncbi:MAG: small multi-drug export protein [Euryarchaeota archaeon]|nr:small multi-drug export protein [Euryarchaeota archaeon]